MAHSSPIITDTNGVGLDPQKPTVMLVNSGTFLNSYL